MAHDFTIPGTLGPRIEVRRTLLGTIRVTADGERLKREGRFRKSHYEVRATDGQTYRFHISGGLGALSVHVEGTDKPADIALERQLEWWEWALILAAYPILFFVLGAGIPATMLWGSIAAGIAARFARSALAAPARVIGMIVASGLTLGVSLAVSVGFALLTTPIPEFEVGSCLNGLATATEITNESIKTVDCDDAHDGEVVGHVTHEGDSYPGEETLNAYAMEACGPLFEQYVGLPYTESTLPMVPFVPLELGWFIGDRTVDCVAYTPRSLVESGSIKGTGRLTAMLPAGLISLTESTIVMADATLDRDLEGTVRIAEDGVTLDCDGHTLIGAGAGAGAGAGILVEDRSEVTVRNCDVSGFEQGIDIVRSRGSTIEDNVARDNMIGVRLLESSGNTLARNQAIESGDIGIRLIASKENRLTENVTKGSVLEGFKVEGGSDDNVLTRNVASGAGRGAAYWLYGSSGNELIENVAEDNATQGFVVAGGSFDAVLADNKALRNEANGFIIDSPNASVAGNQAERNGGDGFIARGAGVDFADNTTRYNRGFGISYDGAPRSTFEGNVCLLDNRGLSQPFGICDPPPGSATVGPLDIVADTTLRADHRGPIRIGGSDVTLDCDGHSIIGVDTGPAIEVIGRSGVTVKNCEIVSWNDAIRLERTRDSRFLNNRARDVQQGFTLRNADDNEFVGNVITGADGWFAYLLLLSSDRNRLVGNVAERGLAGFVMESGAGNEFSENLVIDARGNGFAVGGGAAIDNVFARNLVISTSGAGFALDDGRGTSFSDNVCSRNQGGVPAGACQIDHDIERPVIGEFVGAALVAAGEPEPPRKVPELVGLRVATGLVALRDEGLDGGYQAEHSDTVAPGVVISQGLAPGTSVEPGRVVTYTVSIGPQVSDRVEVPEIVGVSSGTAIERLSRAGLIAAPSEDFSDSVTAGMVVRQDLAPGVEVDAGRVVAYTLSLGPRPSLVVPDLVGLDARSAAEEVRRAGFEPLPAEAHSDLVPSGAVISQGLEAGTDGQLGRKVTYTVSLGPEAGEEP